MRNIQEVKKGLSLDNDSNILFKTGKLVAKNPVVKFVEGEPEDSGEIDIGKIVSNGLEDMFGVFEFECYYPINYKEIAVLDLSTTFSVEKLIELEELYTFPNSEVVWKDLFDFMDSYVTQKSSFSSDKKHRVFDIISNHILDENWDLNSIELTFTAVERLLGTASFKQITKAYSSQSGFENWKKVIAKFDLDLSVFCFYSSDSRFIMRQDTHNDSIDELEDIAADLLKQFKDSIFASDRVELHLTKEKDAEFNGAVWNITEDMSLTDNFPNHIAVEIVSRRIPFTQLGKAIQFMSALFARLGVKTTGKTGLHLNIGFNSPTDIDLLKIVVLTADDYELKLFNRANNQYCRSQIQNLVENKRVSVTNERSIKILWEQIKAFNKDKTFPVNTNSKYVAVNFKKWVQPFPGLKPVLEFRIMGGKDYLKDAAKIIHRSNRFFYIMAVAGNSELYKREYITRLLRISEKSQGKYDKEDNEYWNVEALENSFNNLFSRVKLWNEKDVELNQYNLEDFRDNILEIIKMPVERVPFKLFKTLINPAIKEILKNKQLKDSLEKIKAEIKESGSKKDFAVFTRYFYTRTV